PEEGSEPQVRCLLHQLRSLSFVKNAKLFHRHSRPIHRIADIARELLHLDRSRESYLENDVGQLSEARRGSALLISLSSVCTWRQLLGLALMPRSPIRRGRARFRIGVLPT